MRCLIWEARSAANSVSWGEAAGERRVVGALGAAWERRRGVDVQMLVKRAGYKRCCPGGIA